MRMCIVLWMRRRGWGVGLEEGESKSCLSEITREVSAITFDDFDFFSSDNCLVDVLDFSGSGYPAPRSSIKIFRNSL